MHVLGSTRLGHQTWLAETAGSHTDACRTSYFKQPNGRTHAPVLCTFRVYAHLFYYITKVMFQENLDQTGTFDQAAWKIKKHGNYLSANTWGLFNVSRTTHQFHPQWVYIQNVKLKILFRAYAVWKDNSGQHKYLPAFECTKHTQRFGQNVYIHCTWPYARYHLC